MSEHGPVSHVESIYDDDTSSGKSAIRIASVAALGGFLFGYDSAVINGAVAPIADPFVASAEAGNAWPRRSPNPVSSRAVCVGSA